MSVPAPERGSFKKLLEDRTLRVTPQNPSVNETDLDSSTPTFFKTLSVCDAKTAAHLLCRLEIESFGEVSKVTDFIAALDLFNTPHRLPVFIGVLKLSREGTEDCIDIEKILDWDSDRDPMNRFYETLPPFVLEALKIESNHSPAHVESYAKEKAKKLWKEQNLNKPEQKRERYREFKDSFDPKQSPIVQNPQAHADEEYESLLKKIDAEFYHPSGLNYIKG